MKRNRQANTRANKSVDLNVRKDKFVRQGFNALNPLNQKQADLLDLMKTHSLVGAVGSAGTGKTLLACMHAAQELWFKRKRKIILLRAYQPLAGRTIGFVPGTAEEKLMGFYRQMLDYLEDFLGKNDVELKLKSGDIEMCSLETIRGRSWDDAVIIVDESQSLFIPEVQALVTRVGRNSQIIFCGDNSGIQTDVRNGMDGLTYLDEICYRYNIDEAAFVEFTREDIVRSGLTKKFVCAFEDEVNDPDPICTQEEINSQFKKSR